MTTNEYIDLAHSGRLYDNWESYCNGKYTHNGEEWYPCVILDDDVGTDMVKIVTRNQTHMRTSITKVRRLNQNRKGT